MTTEHKIIGGSGFLTLIIIIGGVWLSGKKEAANSERFSKSMIGERMPDQGAEHVARGVASTLQFKSSDFRSALGWHGWTWD